MLLFYVDDIEAHRVAKLSDTLNEAVREEMNRQNEQATALALAIAGNELLAKSLEQRNREKASYVMDTIMASFEGYNEGGKFWMQLHTPDLRVFVRSWDKSEYGTPLEGFRKGLVYVRKMQRPFSSIELGKKLNIKSIVPIKVGDNYVGSLEIIKNFDEAIKNFKDKKISLLVLMDNKFLDVAERMIDYPFLGDFVLCHREYDEVLYEELKGEDLYSFIGKRKSFTKNYFLSFEPLRDLSGERLGFFVTAIPKERALSLIESRDDISILFQASKEELSLAYKVRSKTVYSGSEEIKKAQEVESKRARYKNLSREELENILIYGEENVTKRGEIR
jgi:hypothetical protein